MNQRYLKDYLTTLILAVVLALLVRQFLLAAYKVPTGSMQPTLKPGDFIFSVKPAYGWRLPFSEQVLAPQLPERGDLIVFRYPDQPLISYVKRVVGLPGDKVEIRQGRLIVNDVPLKYDLVDRAEDNPNPSLFDVYREYDEEISHFVILEKNQNKGHFGPVVVPPSEVFVLGDNRDASDDSRYWGSIPLNQIVGQASLIWLSLDFQKKWGGNRYPQVRWKRVFTTLHLLSYRVFVSLRS